MIQKKVMILLPRPIVKIRSTILINLQAWLRQDLWVGSPLRKLHWQCYQRVSLRQTLDETKACPISAPDLAFQACLHNLGTIRLERHSRILPHRIACGPILFQCRKSRGKAWSMHSEQGNTARIGSP